LGTFLTASGLPHRLNRAARSAQFSPAPELLCGLLARGITTWSVDDLMRLLLREMAVTRKPQCHRSSSAAGEIIRLGRTAGKRDCWKQQDNADI